MPNTEKGKKYLTVDHEIEIPYQMAAKRYGAAVADLMAKRDASVAAEAKRMEPHQFKWHIGWNQAQDPPGIVDYQDFLGALVRGTEVFLICRGGHFKGWQPLDVLPPQVRSKLEERSRLVCNQRTHWGDNGQQDQEPEDEPDGGAAVLDGLNYWLDAHPGADKRLAAVARLALEHLFETGG
jgi:hypothetical protein